MALSLGDWQRGGLAAWLGLMGMLVQAETLDPKTAPLPQPLTLNAALELVPEDHPRLARQLATQQTHDAARQAAQAQNDVEIQLSGELRWVDPSPVAVDQSAADHTVGLLVNKTLYDFGRQAAQLRATEQRQASGLQTLMETRQQYRLQVMERFFAVLLADLQFQVDTEATAIAYVDLDKMREREQRGQRAALEVARADALYQRVLQQRRLSENRQRLSRVQLAHALNRPDQVPAVLSAPALDGNDRPLPSLEALKTQALADNPGLRALRLQVSAAQAQIDAARAEQRPLLTGQLAVSHWEKDFASRDKARAGIELAVPLYTGGRVRAKIAAAHAELADYQAALAQQTLLLEEALITQRLHIQALQAQRASNKTELKFREMELDRSRTLYDLEFQADLGDALVQQSAATLAQAQTDYELALAWAKLEALIGGALPHNTPAPEKAS